MKFTPENIAEAFDIDPSDAWLAVRIVHYKVNPLNMPKKFPKTYEIYSRFGSLLGGNENEMRMSALDELCLTHGVEPIRTSEHIDNYHFDIRASYLNTGDTYATTILLDHRDLRWRLTSWGDFVESLDGKKDSNGDPIEVL